MLPWGKQRITNRPTGHGLRFWIRLAVPTALVAGIAFFRVFLTPDLVFACLLVIFVAYGNGWEFLRRFSPFLALLASYDALRGLVPYVSKHVHYTQMIAFDRWLGFGEIPTVRLQHAWHAESLHWYDKFFFVLYLMQFVSPVLIGILIWRLRDAAYWRYMWSFVAVSYAAFVTYAVFPAAPPWLA